MKLLMLAGFLILACPTFVYPAPPNVSQAATPAVPAKPSFRFLSYDGDSLKDDPKTMSFQVDHMDLPRSAFLFLGDTVPGTKFKLTKFEYKTRKGASGEELDVSELTLVNAETKESVVLIYNTRS